MIDPYFGSLVWAAAVLALMVLVPVAVSRWIFRVNDIVELLKRETEILKRIEDRLSK